MATVSPRLSPAAQAGILDQTDRKFARHVLPLLCLIYFMSWLDRQNVSFAKLQMLDDLGMTERTFGFGASMFFIGYAACAVPSGFAFARLGARRWFSIMIFGWGLATMLMAWNPSELTFYVLRFMVGGLEAGFAPCVFYFISLWIPFDRRNGYMGLFLAAGMISNAIGAPICGALLSMVGMGGLHGWQWLFLLTGLPAVILGIILPRLLTETPDSARFFSDEEKRVLAAKLAEERASHPQEVVRESFWSSISDPRLIAVGGVLFGTSLSSFGLAYWMPTVVREFGVSNMVNGLLNALPWLAAVTTLTLVPVWARRTQRWGLSVLLPLLIAGIALFAIVLVDSSYARMALLCVAAAGIFAPQGILTTLPTVFLNRKSAAPAIAAVNAMASFGGFTAQNAIPIAATASGSVILPMLILSVTLVCTAIGGAAITSTITRSPSLHA